VLAHISAYTILENMRLSIAEKLMKVPLGTVLNQTIRF
jgi:ATP-binding cassette subfamily B protein